MCTISAPDLREIWSATLHTRTGVELWVRPTEPDDKTAIEDFFAHVGADDLRFRFLVPLRRVDRSQIDALCTMDSPRLVSFVAFYDGGPVALATLAGDPDSGKAEVALITRPEWKHQGISWTLLDHVIRFARAQGYGELMSIEKADNEGALRLERDMGFSLKQDEGEIIAAKSIRAN